MSTSLREQLLKLQTPQSSQFVDTRRRDSILFTQKDAATKSRETIYEIGLSGLRELIDIDDSFSVFENTLFDFTVKDVQRAVETDEVNKLLNKNIKRFMFHLSPYFLIPSSHKCLEWLIRRFNINLYNKEEMLMLILPYHHTNMFVRCIQIMNFDNSSDKWNFLSEVKKTSTPLSKLTLWNHGASQTDFLDFVGKFTYDAVKELDRSAGKLQTMISFYFTSMVGSLEHASKINDNHIVTVSRFLLKTYKSNITDYNAAGFMITAQLLAKSSLKEKLLYEFMDRITKSTNIKLARDCILLLALMFQTQTDELKVSDVTLHNLMQMKGFLMILKQAMREGKMITDFYKALIYKLLIKIQEKDGNFLQYKEFCENLLNEIDMDDDLACIIIRTILDSYVQEDTKSPQSQSDDEIVLLDSDDENIPLKSQDVTIWFSNLLKTLERQYPMSFDIVVKNVMTRIPGRKRNGLKNVLGFLLNVSCSTNDTNIFENLYHHNPHIRSEAVSYLVKNLKSIERTPENIDILKMTLTERLNDDNQLVVLEMLKMDFVFLNETVGSDELVARLSKILMKYWAKPEKWNEIAKLALNKMTSEVYKGCTDTNIVLFALMPFLFPKDSKSLEFAQIIKNSNYAATQDALKNLPAIPKDHVKCCEVMNGYFTSHKNLPPSYSILQTITHIVIDNHQLGSIKENFAFYLFACSLKSPIEHEFALKVLQNVKKVYNFPNSTFNNLKIINVHLKNHELSTDLMSTVLIKLINCIKFTSFEINFASPNLEMRLILEIFHFIVDFYFKVQQVYRRDVNEVMIEFLDKICNSNELKKLEFLSQFCVLHAAQYESCVDILEFQIRVMNLFHHVLKSNLVNVQHYSNIMHQNVVLSLCSKSNKIRELGINIIGDLENQNIADNWKFFYGKILARKSEILMDNEQIKMITYLLANKKSSKYIQEIRDNMLKTISNEATFDYIKSELLMLLKHFTDRKVLDVSAQIATKIIDEFNDKENYFFNENHAAIIKLVLMKFNHITVSGLWNLALKSLKCHFIMNDEEGKILTPSILLLQAIDNELYAKLHPDHKMEIFNAIIECSMNEQPRIIQNAQKVFYSIDPDCKIIKNCLLKLTKSTHAKNAKSSELFASKDWKFGIALLELLQNKTKDIEGEHELLALLFDILQNCLRSSESDIEYIKQIILSLLLTICKQISLNGKNHRALGINDSVFKTELIIRCIKETQNPQTHHHSLLLLAQLALMIPDQVLRDIMTIFTFVGTTLVRHDDSYSFQIITKIIENIIPNFLKGAQKQEVIPILKTFAAIALDVPVHRRMMLYVKLMNTFGAENFLWMFIGALLEIQVSQHQKGGSQEELPVRLQIALSIAKEFDIKTIVATATSLIVYLKELPMIIDHTKSEFDSDNENKIFCLKTHTSGQVRHFKYLVSLFLKYILESPEVSNMAHQMSQEKVIEMRTQFQDLILNTLILIPDITKFIELKQHEKSWQIILQTSFDILEASIALLAPDMLLVVVEKLICHDFLVVRKKVLELLNRKLEDDYFKNCENQKLLKLMIPLKNVYEMIGEQNVKLAEEVVQQMTLITIKLLARKLCEETPDPFIDCLNHLTNVMDDKNVRVPVMINLVDCVAELVGELKVHSISLLGKIMPNLVKLLTVQDDNPSTLLLLHSATSSLLKIIETVPLFLSPYLVQIILQLIRVYPVLKLINDSKITLTIGKIRKIWETFAESVPSRILIPTIHDIYEKINQKCQYTSIEPLMELMNEIFQKTDIKDIKSYQGELTEFFMKALQFRCNVKDDDEISFNEINDIELFIIRALIALILKQSEGSFRPLFENISNWAIKDTEENDNNRLITFFSLTTEISIALKSLFLLFASDLVDCAGSILDKCNASKVDELFFVGDTDKTLYLIEFILRTLNNMFLNDHQNFINSQRFEVIMQPIVDQMENVDALKNENFLQLLRMTIGQLAVAASDDILWKQLNHQVLLKTRSENPEIRILGVKTCVDIARKLTEDYETLIPETIPFLSELLADEDYHVVQACESSVRELETIVGESLQKYF